MKVFSFVCFIAPVFCTFNPFSDGDLFDISWAGPARFDKLEDTVEVVTVQTAENERYQCVLPESQASRDANRKASYTGPSPDEIMNKLFQQDACSYRIESYWTYELCHGKHIKQYHENKELGLQKPKLQEYFLGYGNVPKVPKTVTTDSTAEEEIDADAESEPEVFEQEIRSMKLDGVELPFFSVNMSGGSVCDLTGKPRKSHVMYVCQPDGRGEIYQMKETSSCEYEIIVLTAVLCSHPDFKPKDPPVSKIMCHSLDGSPRHPKYLETITHQTMSSKVLLDDVEEDEEEGPKVVYNQDSAYDEESLETKVPPKAQLKPQPPKETGKDIGITADKQLLREFLNGDYCLHGGSGWWKHEFCYGKYAKQYHDEKEGETTSIYLGHWSLEKHKRWLKENPQKVPKPMGQRKQLSLYYSDGDTCDLTGNKRTVEVKMKCLNQPNHPHAVQIYLVEPKTCQYILGVESPIFCDILDKADDFGLLDNLQI